MLSLAGDAGRRRFNTHFPTDRNAGPGSIVSANSAFQNASDGVVARGGSSVHGNSALQNGENGIFTFDGSTVSGNSAHQNGGDGIETTSGCTVMGNTVRGNAGFRLKMGPRSGFIESVVSANQAGMVDGATAVSLGDIACDGTPSCTPLK